MARCYWSQKPLCAWRSRFHANLGLYFFGCGCSVVHSSTSKVYSSIIYYCNSLPWCCYSYSSHVVHGRLEGPIASWLVKQNNLCSIHGGRMHDKEMACRTWPRNTPQTQIFSNGQNIFVCRHVQPKHFRFFLFRPSLGVRSPWVYPLCTFTVNVPRPASVVY